MRNLLRFYVAFENEVGIGRVRFPDLVLVSDMMTKISVIDSYFRLVFLRLTSDAVDGLASFIPSVVF